MWRSANHLIQGIIPSIIFSFHWFDIFSHDVCKRDNGHVKRILKVFINCIESSGPISIIDHRCKRIIISAFCIYKSTNGSYHRNCNICSSSLMRDLLRTPEPICSQLDVHLCPMAYRMGKVCTAVISSCNSVRTFNILTQCLNVSISEVAKFMQPINALVINNGIGSLIHESNVGEETAHCKGIHFAKARNQ